MTKIQKRLLIVAVIAAVVVAFFARDFNMIELLGSIRESAQENLMTAMLIYVLAYLAAALTMVPLGAALLTMGAGVIFGFWLGWAMASFASTFSAFVGFLIARSFRDFALGYIGKATAGVRRAFEEQGVRYLVTLRLIPGLPFAMINYAMGLTKLNWLTYLWVSWVTMSVATGIFVFAGFQISSVDSLDPGNVLSPGVIAGLILLATLPWLSRGFMRVYDSRVEKKSLSRKGHEFDVAVIGAGAAGLSAAFTASGMHAKVLLVDAEAPGGECLNYGCVPTKALLEWTRSTEAQASRAAPDTKWQAALQQVNQSISKIGEHETPEYIQSKGVTFRQTPVTFTKPDVLKLGVSGQQLGVRRTVLAIGAPYILPSIKGVDESHAVTPSTLWQREKLGNKIVILGAGPSGCEFADALSRLGYGVTLIEWADRILPSWPEDGASAVAASLKSQGVDIRTGASLSRVKEDAQQRVAEIMSDSESQETAELPFDTLLVTYLRKSVAEDLGLDLSANDKGAITVGSDQRTSIPNIFAAGDCTGISNTVAAGRAGRVAGANARLGLLGVLEHRPSACPQAVYTSMQLARVGVQADRAEEYEAEVLRFTGGDRAACAGDDHAYVELVHRGSKLLGGLVCGPNASDQLGAIVASLGNGGMQRLTRAQAYPSWSYAVERAAHSWSVTSPTAKRGQALLARIYGKAGKGS